jgi:hypothetical protein
VIIGNTATFGIEYSTSTTHIADHEKWVYGHFCFWAKSNRVGNADEICTLNDAVIPIRNLTKNRGKRFFPELMLQSSTVIFETINRALYVDDDRSDEQVKSDWEKYSVCIATPIGLDVFDGVKAFLIEDGRQGRFVWKETTSEGEIQESKLRRGEFDDALETFLQELEMALL